MVASRKLTARQKEVLTFIDNRHRQTGVIPTLRETADYFGFSSPNAVREHLRLIEKKGFLRRVPGRSRSLVVIRLARAKSAETPRESVQVPLLGRIAAGSPALAQENTEAMLTLPAQFFRGSQLFAVHVRGDSMTGAGILDGDIAVLDGIPEARDGQIAAVLIDDEATLKRVYRRPQGLLLKAENPGFADIEISRTDAGQVRLLGVLIGLVRKI